MIDTRLLFKCDIVVIRANPYADIIWRESHKLVTAWLERDRRKREMGCVGVCSPSRARLLTAAAEAQDANDEQETTDEHT